MGSKGRPPRIQEDLRIPTPIGERYRVLKTRESSGLSLLHLCTSCSHSAFQLHLKIAVHDTNDFRPLIRMSGEPADTSVERDLGDNAVLDACTK